MDIFDELYEKYKDQIKDPEPSPYYHISEGIGKLLSFYRDYDVILKKMILESEAFLTYTDYLQDIEYLPITFMHTNFPLVKYFWVCYDRRNPNGSTNLLSYSRNPGRDAQIGAPADLEWLYLTMEWITEERIVSYITDYAKAKKYDLERLDLVIQKNIFPNHSDWLKEVRGLWVYGVQPYSDLAEFDISEYQRHRNEFFTDRIIRAAYDENLSELKQVKEDMQQLKKRNDLLQDMLRSSKPECELWFTGLDEIAQQDYDPRKVSLKLEYEPWEVIDDRKLAKDKYKATKIYISYEGVNDSGECKPLTLYNGPCRIRDEEKKLLIKLAFYQGNAAKLKDILAESKADCVAHLNTMYNTIFNLTGRSNFIDKENGILKVKLDYKRPKSF